MISLFRALCHCLLTKTGMEAQNVLPALNQISENAPPRQAQVTFLIQQAETSENDPPPAREHVEC